MWLKKDNENSSKPARQTYSRCWLFFVSICSFQVIAVSSAFDGRALVSNTLYASQSSKLTLSRSSEEERSLNNDDEKITIVRPHRIRQKRCRPTRRRPDYYWSDPNNLQLELRTFWTDRGVKLPKNKPPPIPNEVILRYYERHDLRAALVKYGGREAVSQVLGGSMIVPGRWRDALNESPELLTLVKADATLSTKSPPSLTAVRSTTRIDEASRWKHNNDRKPKGYWNKKTLLKEIYAYVAVYREKHQRPTVWMPRPSEFAKEGRDDIRQALNRFGGSDRICRLAGMVPFREWYYFEGQLELMMELQRFLKQHGNGDSNSFPVVEDVKRHGFDQLYSLIQYYGGRKFLAARLGMNTSDKSDQFSDLNFGPFSLEFAVRLLSFIRQRELRKNPPLANPSITIPSPSQLASGEEEATYLHESIVQYGGYENVARRLGLAFFAMGGR